MLVFATDVLTNAAMWAGIVGFVSPLVIQTLTKLHRSRAVQAGIAFVWCLVASAGTAYFAAELDLHDFVKSALIVFTLAMASYKGFWNPVGLTPTNTDRRATR